MNANYVYLAQVPLGFYALVSNNFLQKRFIYISFSIYISL